MTLGQAGCRIAQILFINIYKILLQIKNKNKRGIRLKYQVIKKNWRVKIIDSPKNRIDRF